jgi:hypothetical protein
MTSSKNLKKETKPELSAQTPSQIVEKYEKLLNEISTMKQET